METHKIIIMEFFGRGDPFFGGSADDRTLCADGVFRSTGHYRPDQVARFETKAEALEFALGASNARPGGIISPMTEVSR